MGAAIGGGLGLLIAGIIFPIGEIVIGALAGAAVGAATDHGIQKSFVKEVGELLENGQSALFVIVQDANATAVMSMLSQHKGHVYQTSLPADVEASLRAPSRARTAVSARPSGRRWKRRSTNTGRMLTLQRVIGAIREFTRAAGQPAALI